MKKTAGVLIFFCTLSIQSFGIDTTRIDVNVPVNVTVGTVCKRFTNTGPNSIFAPSGNANDFNAFIAHPPAGVTISDCEIIITGTNPVCTTGVTLSKHWLSLHCGQHGNCGGCRTRVLWAAAAPSCVYNTKSVAGFSGMGNCMPPQATCTANAWDQVRCLP